MNGEIVIVILGGGLIKDKNGEWHTTHFSKGGDNFGALGDRLRVMAGAHLYKHNLDAFVIASGGKGQYRDNPDVPSVSSVVKKELIEHGVPEERIVEENKSNNTYEQLLELKKIKGLKNLKNIIIISNNWHLPRIKAMIHNIHGLDLLKEMYNNSIIKIKSAESILIKFDSNKWKIKLQRIYESDAMKKRIKLEKQGVKQIKEGTYNFR